MMRFFEHSTRPRSGETYKVHPIIHAGERHMDSVYVGSTSFTSHHGDTDSTSVHPFRYTSNTFYLPLNYEVVPWT